MKKLIMGACALMALAAVSCGKCGSGKCETATDSLSTAYGNYVGTMIFADYQQMDNNDKDNKNEFLRGMQVVFGADDSRNTRMGMQVGIQMMAELQQLEEQGVEINKVAVMNAFKEAFLSDSISFTEMQSRAANFQTIYREALDRAEAAKAAARGEEPAAVANVKKGIKYVEEQRKANPEIKVAPDGLAYLIETEGTGDKPDENATVVVNYTGKHINGEVFDSTEGRGPATFNLQGVVTGFREGLMLLGKGGKATLYIPGELAYGKSGQQAAGIEPNEMLVFDVELLDINPAE